MKPVRDEGMIEFMDGDGGRHRVKVAEVASIEAMTVVVGVVVLRTGPHTFERIATLHRRDELEKLLEELEKLLEERDGGK